LVFKQLAGGETRPVYLAVRRLDLECTASVPARFRGLAAYRGGGWGPQGFPAVGWKVSHRGGK